MCPLFVMPGRKCRKNRALVCLEHDSKLLRSDVVQAWMRGLSPEEIQLTLDADALTTFAELPAMVTTIV